MTKGPIPNRITIIGAGTDVLGMSTVAEKSSDGSYYKVNGAKMWITNGTLDGKSTGDVYLVYAKTGKNGVFACLSCSDIWIRLSLLTICSLSLLLL